MGAIKRLLTEESGQGLVEYGLILALIAIGVIVALGLLGNKVENTFNNIENKM